MLTIADLDQHLSNHGNFCLIDWLLLDGILAYSDYEAWRYVQRDHLDTCLALKKGQLNTLFIDASTHCQSLGLVAETQTLYPWDKQRETPLSASSSSTKHRQLTQKWLPGKAAPQLDLFIDNAAAIAENHLREALINRQWESTEHYLNKMAALNPMQSTLGAYQGLVSYAQHMAACPGVAAEAVQTELSGLENEVEPLAREVLGQQARDFLSVAWRRLARGMSASPADPDIAHKHPSYALMKIPDWQALQHCLLADTALYRHPVLLARLATSYSATRQDRKALLLWCLVADGFPEQLPELLEQHTQQAIYTLWEDFQALFEYREGVEVLFAAYVVLKRPALLAVGHSFQSLQHNASQAAIDLALCRQQNKDEIAAREALKAASPVLLSSYLKDHGSPAH